MKIMLQIGIVFVLCFAGEGISGILPFAFPGSVISMILLFLLLLCKVIKIEHLKEKTDFMLQNMAFFFIPAGVGLINYYDVMKGSIVPLLFICLITTVLTFAAAAFTVSAVIKLQNKRKQ